MVGYKISIKVSDMYLSRLNTAFRPPESNMTLEQVAGENTFISFDVAQATMDGLNPTRMVRKIVSSPMPKNLTPVHAVQVDMGTEFGCHENRCLNIIRNRKEAGHRGKVTDFTKNMVVTYRSKNLLPHLGESLALLGAGLGADRTELHLLARLASPEGCAVAAALGPRMAAFAVQQTNADVILHIEPHRELDQADLG